MSTASNEAPEPVPAEPPSLSPTRDTIRVAVAALVVVFAAWLGVYWVWSEMRRFDVVPLYYVAGKGVIRGLLLAPLQVLVAVPVSLACRQSLERLDRRSIAIGGAIAAACAAAIDGIGMWLFDSGRGAAARWAWDLGPHVAVVAAFVFFFVARASATAKVGVGRRRGEL